MSVRDYQPASDFPCGLRMDNVNEWAHQFFEKLVKANKKYCPTLYQE